MLFGGYKRRRNIERILKNTLEGDLRRHWQIDENGNVIAVRYVHDGFHEEETMAPVIKRCESQEGRVFPLGNLVRTRGRKAVQKHISSVVVQEALASMHDTYASAVTALRDVDLKGLVFISHKLHRKSAVDGLRGVIAEEFADCIKARWPEIVKAANAANLEYALMSGEKIPRDARFILRNGSTTVVVLEQPPRIRTLQIRTGDEVVSRDLALPYVVFVIEVRQGSVNRVKCGFSNDRIDSLEQDISWPALPHVESGLSVCLGSTDRSEAVDLDQLCSQILYNFWSTEFIMHEPGGHSHDQSAELTFDSVESEIDSFEAWEELTAKNGAYASIGNVWRPFEHTLQEIVDDLLPHEESESATEAFTKMSETVSKEVARELLMRATAKAERLPLTDQMQGNLDELAAKAADTFEAALSEKIAQLDTAIFADDVLVGVVDTAIKEMFADLSARNC